MSYWNLMSFISSGGHNQAQTSVFFFFFMFKDSGYCLVLSVNLLNITGGRIFMKLMTVFKKVSGRAKC